MTPRIALFSLILTLSGCFSTGMVPAEPLMGTVERVAKRHDAAIAANTSMSKAAKAQALMDTENLLLNFQEALKESK